MSELPEGWIETTIGEVAESMKNGIYKPASSYADDGVACLRMYNIAEGKIVWMNIKRMRLSSNEIKDYQLLAGDLLVNRVNSRELVGKSAVVSDGLETCVFESKNIRLRLRPEVICPEVVNYALLLGGQRYFNSNAQQVVGMASISQPQIAAFPLRLPPINEQRRIVAKLEKLLSRVDAAQARLATIPRILKRFRQSVLASACSGRLTADWRKTHSEVELGSELMERIRRTIIERYRRACDIAKIDGTRKPKVPNVLLNLQPDPLELPDLPPRWSWSYLQNLGEFTRGKSKHRPRNDPTLFGGEYPFIQTGDVSRSHGRIVRHSQTYNEAGLAQSRLFPRGTLCITIAANIAETAILTYPACFPDSVVGFIPEEELFEAFWAMYFVRIVQNDLETFAPATAQKNINMDILFKVAVPVPPLAEQQEIVRRVEALFKTADALEARYRSAKAHVDRLTESILARAFRGELVLQDPNDEPATVFLGRIKKQSV